MKPVIAIIALFIGCAGHTQAQTYPVKPLRLIAPYAVGGPADLRGRIFAQALVAQFGQPVVIENQGGGGGVVGANIVAKAPKDAYTAILFNATVLATAGLLADNLPYDPDKDFDAVAPIAFSPLALVVDAKLGINTVAELVARAKAAPGKMYFGSAGASSLTRLAVELFMAEAGVDIVHIPYKGMSLALSDMLGGRVQLMISSYGMYKGQVDAGKLRIVAILGRTRHPTLPDVPTAIEQGWPDLVVTSWQGVVAPANTSVAILDRLEAAYRQAAADPATAKLLEGLGYFPIFRGRRDAQRLLREDTTKWASIINELNIRLD